MTSTKSNTWLTYLTITGLVLLYSFNAFAAGGGLQVASTKAMEIRTWLYSFLGITAIGYILFKILMAYMHRGGWGDVGMAVIYAVVAGGSILAGEWAWSVWGS